MIMKVNINKSGLGNVLVLLVLAIFMVSIMLILLAGADVVDKFNQRDQNSYAQRTVVQYLTTRIHQSDVSDRISVRETEDGTVVVITETIDEYDYETLLYCYDGYLCELFVSADSDIQPEFGERILPLNSCMAEIDGSHLQLKLTYPDGTKENLHLMIRAEGGPVYEQ